MGLLDRAELVLLCDKKDELLKYVMELTITYSDTCNQLRLANTEKTLLNGEHREVLKEHEELKGELEVTLNELNLLQADQDFVVKNKKLIENAQFKKEMYKLEIACLRETIESMKDLAKAIKGGK
jgi:hypothetical protein